MNEVILSSNECVGEHESIGKDLPVLKNYFSHNVRNIDGGTIEHIKAITGGTIGVICPVCYCFNLRNIHTYINTSIKGETIPSVDQGSAEDNGSDVYVVANPIVKIVKCQNCCSQYVEAITTDPNLAKIISILNKKNYVTNYSCEGHGTSASYIYFDTKISENILQIFDTIPLSWYIDTEDLKEDKLIIRSDKDDYPCNVIELEKWVEGIPVLNPLYNMYTITSN